MIALRNVGSNCKWFEMLLDPSDCACILYVSYLRRDKDRKGVAVLTLGVWPKN